MDPLQALDLLGWGVSAVQVFALRKWKVASLIKEEDIEKAVNWLRDNAEEAAQARANRIYVEEYRKTVKARLMAGMNDKPIGAQEAFAYGHKEYVAHLEAIREAVRIDEEFRFLREAAQAKIEAWRTQSSNQRAEGKAYGT